MKFRYVVPLNKLYEKKERFMHKKCVTKESGFSRIRKEKKQR